MSGLKIDFLFKLKTEEVVTEDFNSLKEEYNNLNAKLISYQIQLEDQNNTEERDEQLEIENIKLLCPIRNFEGFYFSYVKTTVEYEKLLKEDFVSFLATNHPDIIIAGSNNKVSTEKYCNLLYRSINDDKKLKSNLIVLNDYLGTKLTFIRLYINIIDELEYELNQVLNNS